MIDVHCHLLPGIDDGAQDLSQSLQLIERMQQQGVSRLVCTPHINPPAFANDRQRIQDCFEQHQQAMSSLGVGIAFAAEVRVHADLPFVLDSLPLFYGQDQRFMLLELPTREFPIATPMICDWLLEQGIRPVIAHPERNHELQQPSKRLALKRQGVWFQLTAGSLIGDFGPAAQRAARDMLDQQQVDIVASDSHNLQYRPPKMAAAHAWLCEHYHPDLAETLLHTNPNLMCARMFND